MSRNQIEFAEQSNVATAENNWRVAAVRETYPEAENDRSRSGGMIFADSCNRPLNAEDIRGKSASEIWIAKNEIYARHGRTFSNPELSSYFSQKDWYQPDPNYRDALLSPLERRNAMYLNIVELDNDLNSQRNRFQPESTVDPNLPGSIIPDSSYRKLEVNEVMQMSTEKIRAAQNEIYARHGYPFQNPELKARFEQMPWYRCNPNFTESELSWMEERNIQMMHLVEMDRRYGQ